MDIRQVAENLIVSLWAESDKLRHQAEGVRLFLQTIITEAEKENKDGQQDTNAGPTEKKEEQVS